MNMNIRFNMNKQNYRLMTISNFITSIVMFFCFGLGIILIMENYILIGVGFIIVSVISAFMNDLTIGYLTIYKNLVDKNIKLVK